MTNLDLYRRIGLLGVTTAFLTIGGCRNATEPGPVPDVPFATDASAYLAQRLDGPLVRYRFRVISHFQNRSAVPVYLGRCGPSSPRPLFSVIVAAPTNVESGYSQAWACVGHNAQFEILPGASRRDTFDIEGPNVFPHGSTVGFGTNVGLFRLYFDVRLAPGDGALMAPLQSRLSNGFVVRVAQ